ncbi:MAG: hypothetical protein BWY83_01659 [bacterium ADurb.Bin478]|nr:MAG: hypothetical protein BWY83_01659 [bacterium ADurb.Bin478]
MGKWTAGLLCFFCMTSSLPIKSDQQKGLVMEWKPHADVAYTAKTLKYDFKGYTSRWEEFSWKWFCSRGVFQTAQPDIQSLLLRMEKDIANQLLLEELWIQPGFLSLIEKKNPVVLRSPSRSDVQQALLQRDVFVVISHRDPVAGELLEKLPEELTFRRNKAFVLHWGNRLLFVSAGYTPVETERLYGYLQAAVDMIRRYTIYKGWMGVHTNDYLITPAVRTNPYELINKALQVGCSWMAVSGYNDFMLSNGVNQALAELRFPFIFMPGQYGSGGVMYGMEHYPEVQDNTVASCLDWCKKNQGYYFSTLPGDEAFADEYHGYVVKSAADQEAVEKLAKPFITNAETIERSTPPALLLFLEKNEPLAPASIMRAILARRNAAVFENGAVLALKELLNPLRILILEQEHLSRTFMDFVSLDAQMEQNRLLVTLHNSSESTLQGRIRLHLPPGVTVVEHADETAVSLNAQESRLLTFTLNSSAVACGKDNPVAVRCFGDFGAVAAMTHWDLPHRAELHPLILDLPGPVDYPITLWNSSAVNPFTSELTVTEVKTGKRVHAETLVENLAPWQKKIIKRKIALPQGDYEAVVAASGDTVRGHIAVRRFKGKATVREEDLNQDGVPEIVLENQKVKATILLTGGRIIEYIIKSRNENLLFKLWPQTPPWHDEPRGALAFYPYGGLEEFIGYPYIAGKIIYEYKVVQASGNFVRVELWANIHGSKIAKTVTLPAESQVLEVRYSLNEMDPSLHVIGINPLIEIGPSTGPEDDYIFPEKTLVHRSPVLDRYYGAACFLEEGWAVGYDTRMDVSLLIGYPVNDAIYLHMWNNHPDNTPTPYYYTELQPWLAIKPLTTTYFSYYLLGCDGPWPAALEAFKKLGLVTKKRTSQ